MATLRNDLEQKASTQSVTLSTAGMRALVSQLQALYLRTPMKLFRPSRFDYMVYVREQVNKHSDVLLKPYRFHTHSSIAMLVTVLKREGWRFIPETLLPPLLANSATGVILYGTYLTALEAFDRGKGTRANHEYSPVDTWRAGFIAGAVQLLAAAPLDAIYSRLSTAEMISGKHENLWKYGAHKLKEIGLVGVFAGYAFSLIKESFGFAFYFSTFELVKTRGYNMAHRIVSRYRSLKASLQHTFAIFGTLPPPLSAPTRPSKFLKSTFVLLAGASAAVSLLAVQYPISKVQKIHFHRLEALDIYNAAANPSPRRPFIKLYYNSYLETYHLIQRNKRKANLTWFQLAYKGFARNALTAVPATSVGLLVFEIMRTRLDDSDTLAPLDSS